MYTEPIYSVAKIFLSFESWLRLSSHPKNASGRKRDNTILVVVKTIIIIFAVHFTVTLNNSILIFTNNPILIKFNKY